MIFDLFIKVLKSDKLSSLGVFEYEWVNESDKIISFKEMSVEELKGCIDLLNSYNLEFIQNQVLLMGITKEEYDYGFYSFQIQKAIKEKIDFIRDEIISRQ